MNTKFDLENRLLEFSARVARPSESLPRTETRRQIAHQPPGAGTSPYAYHGEAEDAESIDDFVHTLKLCLKESREAWRGIRLMRRIPLVEKPALPEPQSIITAKANRSHRNAS